MTQPECPHETLEFVATATVVDSPSFVYASLSVRCEACKAKLHWRGLASGYPNPDNPVVSADGYELRAPIAPGPGAVVGLLEKTNMLDRLVSPNGEASP